MSSYNFTGRILGADDASEWDVVIIEAGKSLNGFVYPPEVLEQAVEKFESVPCYAFEFSGNLYDHLPEEVKEKVPVGFIKNMVGYFHDVKSKVVDGKKSIVAKFRVAADWLKNLLSNIPRDQIGKLFGFSIDAWGDVDQDGTVRNIERVDSVDLVSHPAAGGRFLTSLATQLAESISSGEVRFKTEANLDDSGNIDGQQQHNVDSTQTLMGSENAKGGIEEMNEVINAIKSLEESASVTPEALRSIFASVLDPATIDKNAEALLEAVDRCREFLKESKEELAVGYLQGLIEAMKKDKYKTPYCGYEYPSPQKASETPQRASDEVAGKINELVQKLEQMELERALENALATSGLTEASKRMVKESVRRIEDIQPTIARFKDLEAAFVSIQPVSSVSHVEAEGEKLLKMLEDAFEGKASLREAYQKWTGDTKITGLIRNCYQQGRMRMTESLSSADWPEALGNTIHRFLIKEYNAPGLQDWRKIVSDVVPLSDFRPHRWVRIGGYGSLPSVAERETYPELTSPPDEEVVLTPAKRGGIESVTLEMIRNDDILALKNIPRRLGRAAAYALHRAIFWDVFVSNPTIYDGVALFHANHGNLSNLALNHTGLMDARTKMAKQTAYGDTLALNLYPKFLIGPVDLEDMMYKLCHSKVYVGVAPYTSGGAPAEAATTPNIVSSEFGSDYIVVPYWTDTNDWVAVCDPNDCPTLIVGFLDGKQEPELFVADNPTVGSMFTADKISYKIRHVWGVAVADYRGMVKAVVS